MSSDRIEPLSAARPVKWRKTWKPQIVGEDPHRGQRIGPGISTGGCVERRLLPEAAGFFGRALIGISEQSALPAHNVRPRDSGTDMKRITEENSGDEKYPARTAPAIDLKKAVDVGGVRGVTNGIQQSLAIRAEPYGKRPVVQVAFQVLFPHFLHGCGDIVGPASHRCLGVDGEIARTIPNQGTCKSSERKSGSCEKQVGFAEAPEAQAGIDG